jgi:hypothetical protein
MTEEISAFPWIGSIEADRRRLPLRFDKDIRREDSDPE